MNAVSSTEGKVTLAMDVKGHSTRFTIGQAGKFKPTNSYAILLDRILELSPFKTAALKVGRNKACFAVV